MLLYATINIKICLIYNNIYIKERRKGKFMEQFKNYMLNFFKNFGTNILEAVAVLLIGILVIKIISRVTRALLHRTKLEGTASSFVASLINAAIALVIFFAILNVFKIDTSSVVSIIAASGLAIGLALQDSLSNVASGIILLFTKPFKENDLIAIGSFEGNVKKIKITTTEILTTDNIAVTIPNSKVVSSEITNYSARPTRRFDIIVSASYESNPDKVMEILNGLIDEDERILKTPAPSVIVVSLSSSAVDYRVRGWTATDNYWPIKNSWLETVLKAFKENDIEIPYSRMNIVVDPAVKLEKEDGNDA